MAVHLPKSWVWNQSPCRDETRRQSSLEEETSTFYMQKGKWTAYSVAKRVSSSSHCNCSPVFPGLLFPTVKGLKHLATLILSWPCDWLWPVKHDWEWRVPLLGKRQKICRCSTWFAIFPFPRHGDWWCFRRCRLWQPSHQVRTMQSTKLCSPEMAL